MSKRNMKLDSFFTQNKKQKLLHDAGSANSLPSEPPSPSIHPTYPFPIPQLPTYISQALATSPPKPGREISNHPDLHLLYFEPYFSPSIAKELFQFLRRELFFYRVQYKINRFGKSQDVITPRYTTVFGIDETSLFSEDGLSIIDNPSNLSNSLDPKPAFQYPPRPIPACLQHIRTSIESATNESFNFCLVNYYASGSDSIAYHSDDEHFLGPDPTIASFSLGAKRDFLLKHKTMTSGTNSLSSPVVKLPLAGGDCVVMKGKTQSKWLHSIPKRSGKSAAAAEGGRINITFRKAMIRAGTNNYYHYNVGKGQPFKWSDSEDQMVPWEKVG